MNDDTKELMRVIGAEGGLDLSFDALFRGVGPSRTLRALADLVDAGLVGAFKGTGGEAVWTTDRSAWEK